MNILEVFTKEYKRDVEYAYFIRKMRDHIKLKASDEDIDEKINRLKEIGYESNFSIKIGEHF